MSGNQNASEHLAHEPPTGVEEVAEHRRRIDRIDKTIVALLAERLRVGLVLGDLKRELDWPTRSPTRESDVLAAVRAAAANSLAPESIERIFTVIVAETGTLQEAEQDHG